MAQSLHGIEPPPDTGRFSVPPAQVAEWAGSSVAMLFAAYATCISGQVRELLPRIEVAQALRGLHMAA